MIDGKIRGMIGALMSLRPGAQWSMSEEDYDSIIWLEPEGGMIKPSREEVEAEILRLDVLYAQYDYQRKRAPEYPPLQDLADAIYWQSQGDNSKMEQYLAAVAEVKQKYPK
jgi:hypothetical protein